MEVTVAIAEGQEVVRRGLDGMLDVLPGVHRRSYDTLDELVRQAVDTGWARISLVNVVALWGAGRDLRRRLGRSCLVAMVPSKERAHLAMAAQATVDGYVLLPELSTASLQRALRDVVDGRRHVSEEMAAFLLEWERHALAELDGRSPRLSPRESEVLELIVDGLSNKEISRRLGISVHGVKRHVSSILSKVNSPSRSHLVSSVLRGRLWDPSSNAVNGTPVHAPAGRLLTSSSLSTSSNET